MRDAWAEAVEDRSAGQEHGPADKAVVLAGLSLCPDLYPSAGERTESAVVESVRIALNATPSRANP